MQNVGYKGKFTKKKQLLKIKTSVELVNNINRTRAESKQVSTGDLNVTKMENVDTNSDSGHKVESRKACG